MPFIAATRTRMSIPRAHSDAGLTLGPMRNGSQLVPRPSFPIRELGRSDAARGDGVVLRLDNKRGWWGGIEESFRPAFG